MSIRLEPVTAANWRKFIALSVEPGQERYVASNLYSIAQSRVEPWWEIEGIYAGDEPVGFTMYGKDGAEAPYWICRLMIDRNYQRRGYGRAAMREVLGRLRRRTDCSEIRISFEPDNRAARALYLELGFEDSGEVEDGEVVFVMRVPNADADRE